MYVFHSCRLRSRFRPVYHFSYLFILGLEPGGGMREKKGGGGNFIRPYCAFCKEQKNKTDL